MVSGIESPVHDDFNDYFGWVRLAARASDTPQSPTALRNAITKDWEDYDNENRIVFTAGVQSIWGERRALRKANEDVHRALARALNVVPSDVKDSCGMLQRALEDRQNRLTDMLRVFNDPRQWQEVSYDGAFKGSLAQYVRHAINMYESQATSTETWRKFDPTTITMGRTRKETRNAVRPLDEADRLKNHAATIQVVLDSEQTLPGSPATSPSPPKRGHEDDANEHAKPASKKARPTNGPIMQAGAHRQQQQKEQASDGPALPNTTQAEHEETGGDQRVRFPIPHGEPRENAYWLFDNEMSFASPFHEWCLRQVIANNYQTMSDLEDLAEAFYIFYEHTREDHDWEHEEDVPFLPMPLEAYRKGWSADGPRNWTNVRRLHDMIRDESEDTREYFLRHLHRNVEYQHHAIYRADMLIDALLDKGKGHDWSEGYDQWENAAKADDMRVIDPEDVAGTGKWAYWGNVGEGGNGRAVLYLKLNSNGRILQRLVVKESYIGGVWNSTPSWHGRIEDRKPIEAGIHEMVPRHRHIVEYLGFHVLKQLKMIRHYTAYAELGDLSTIFKNHAMIASLHDQDGKPLLGPVHVPIVAALCIFEAMAASVCLMAHGTLPNDRGVWPSGRGSGDAPAIPWEHNIIHQDIKLPNYFLSSGPVGSKAWSGLPIAALGDFGNSIDMAEAIYSEKPSLAAHEQGTPRWMAPEQLCDSELTHDV